MEGPGNPGTGPLEGKWETAKAADHGNLQMTLAPKTRKHQTKER
jgi:hypothetical protein